MPPTYDSSDEDEDSTNVLKQCGNVCFAVCGAIQTLLAGVTDVGSRGLMTRGENPPVSRENIRNAAKDLYLRYPGQLFLDTYHVDVNTFRTIVERMRPYFESSLTKKPYPTELKIASCLHLLAHGSSVRSQCELHGLSRSTVSRSFCIFLNAMKNEYWGMIKFSSEEERLRSSRNFEEKGLLYGAAWVPQILGAVDGTHVNIKAPCINALSYVNRKGLMSLNVQACVNAEMEIIHLYVGAPGRVHDQNVFDNSGLASIIPENWMVLGDGGYRSSRKVLTPFRENGHLTARQQTFNEIQSSLRKVVERAFGVLKKRFKILNFLDYDDLETMKHIIIVCCLLHNLTISSANEFDTLSDVNEIDPHDEECVEHLAGLQEFKLWLVARMLPDVPE